MYCDMFHNSYCQRLNPEGRLSMLHHRDDKKTKWQTAVPSFLFLNAEKPQTSGWSHNKTSNTNSLTRCPEFKWHSGFHCIERSHPDTSHRLSSATGRQSLNAVDMLTTELSLLMSSCMWPLYCSPTPWHPRQHSNRSPRNISPSPASRPNLTFWHTWRHKSERLLVVLTAAVHCRHTLLRR